MAINILVFCTENFNRTLDELKNKLQFNLIFYNSRSYLEQPNQNFHIILIENEFLLNHKKLEQINFDNFKLPLILISNFTNKQSHNFLNNQEIYFPLNFFDFKKKVNDLLVSYKFNTNSSININNYIIDKNLKIMKKDKVFISLTEREINLLVTLNDEKKPINKNIILKKVWRYSSNVDTHTVETHIYRLRKKVLNKFGDKNFIKIFKEGYSL